MPADLVGYRVDDANIARIGQKDHERLSRHHLKPGDIVYGRRGDIGRHALITDREQGWLCGTGCLRVRFGNASVEPQYVSYYLRQSPVIEWILSNAVGTTIANLNTAILESVPLELPPLPVQQRIADVLGALDDKIEVNQRINRVLEQVAQALFRHWFVDFGPFQGGEFVESELGPIPAGWEVTTIGSVCKVISGSTPKTKVAEYWEDGDIYWATPTDMTALSSPVILETSRSITTAGLKSCSAQLLPAGSVLVTSRATLGVAAINYAPMATNQGFKSMICSHRVTNHFMLLYVQLNQDQITGNANGSTFLEISGTNFKALPLVVPPPDVMHAFEAIVKPLYDQIVVNERENDKLAATRDYLLPRLLSGEVTVPEGEALLAT
jgi:type I restriction enzyme S subunit